VGEGRRENARLLRQGGRAIAVLGIDARAAVEEPAGRGRYVRELLRALARRDDDHVYELYARARWEEELDDRFRWRLLQTRDPLWNVRAARAASTGCSAFLSSNSYLTAWFLRVPSVVVVYDLVAFRPEVRPRRSSGLIERATIGLGVRRAAHLLCISDATRSDLVARYPGVEPKTSVVPLAADEQFARPISPGVLDEVRSRHGLDEEFVLCTGTLEPRKNLLRVLEAHAGSSRRAQLVLVGPAGWEFEPILEAAGRRNDVRVLGRVSDEDLAALYHACTVFCYPSLYEGFGLPLLEAMAAGAACVTSRVSSLPEVGGDAVVYVRPESVEEIRTAIERLLTSEDERRVLGELAARRARGFSWDRSAAGTLAALEELIGATT
jgi:glycosyltransferase involved in cell wall biosynthesis